MQRNVQLNVGKDLLGAKEMAEILDIGKSSVYDLVRKTKSPTSGSEAASGL